MTTKNSIKSDSHAECICTHQDGDVLGEEGAGKDRRGVTMFKWNQEPLSCKVIKIGTQTQVSAQSTSATKVPSHFI